MDKHRLVSLHTLSLSFQLLLAGAADTRAFISGLKYRYIRPSLTHLREFTAFFSDKLFAEPRQTLHGNINYTI